MPNRDRVQAVAGRYEGDEVGSVFQVTPTQQGVVFRREGSPGRGSELKPVARDTFQAGRLTVRFRRDKDGKVVAFGFSGPVLRDLRFTRLSDRT